jgi:hypothetical protein
MVTERRKHPRFEVSLPVSIHTEEGVIQGEVRNISLGGVFIHCRKLPDLGETFRITIEAAETIGPVSATVKPIRVNVEGGDDTPISYVLAVSFVEISGDLLSVLSDKFCP